MSTKEPTRQSSPPPPLSLDLTASGVRPHTPTAPPPPLRPEPRAEATKDLALAFGDAWSYAPAPEAKDHVRIEPRYELFIGGKWRAPESKTYFDTVNPATEEKLAEVAEAGERDVDLAVQAARSAYER